MDIINVLSPPVILRKAWSYSWDTMGYLHKFVWHCHNDMRHQTRSRTWTHGPTTSGRLSTPKSVSLSGRLKPPGKPMGFPQAIGFCLKHRNKNFACRLLASVHHRCQGFHGIPVTWLVTPPVELRILYVNVLCWLVGLNRSKQGNRISFAMGWRMSWPCHYRSKCRFRQGQSVCFSWCPQVWVVQHLA